MPNQQDRRPLYYILADDGATPIPVPDQNVLVWARWFERSKRIVRSDRVGIARVSTVFLGVDHNWTWREAAPILWETMIFGGFHDQTYQTRYHTKAEALVGHETAIKLVRSTPWRYNLIWSLKNPIHFCHPRIQIYWRRHKLQQASTNITKFLAKEQAKRDRDLLPGTKSAN